MLERGEAGLLARAVAVLVQDVTQATRPVPYLEMLTFAPFCQLGKNCSSTTAASNSRPCGLSASPSPRRCA